MIFKAFFQVGFIFKFKMLLSLSHSQKYQGSAGFLVRKVTQLPVHFSTGIIIYLFSFFLKFVQDSEPDLTSLKERHEKP